MNYYNTTERNGKQVEIFNTKNIKQDVLVLDVIKQLGTFSAKDIYNNYPIANTPLTSLRRSINTHKNNCVISETGVYVMGLYGRNEKQYKLTSLIEVTL